jgi:hypothetical protein
MLLWAGLASCESRPATVGTPDAARAAPADSATTPAVAATYVCPMACEGSASDKPGKCPVCEMELEPNPAYKAAAH